MTKVHPNAGSANASPPTKPLSTSDCDSNSAVLTVWKKSLLFSCDGFTVFDATGNLVFRVDNYIAGNRGEIVLMDTSGKSLLTIRRKKLSLGDCWLVFDGETAVNPRYSVRKPVNLLQRKCLAIVGPGNCRETKYEIEGSYAQRSCSVYDGKRRRVAEIKQKEAAVKGVAFGRDVFRLVVHGEFDLAVAMGLVIVLDQMFGSSSSSRS